MRTRIREIKFDIVALLPERILATAICVRLLNNESFFAFHHFLHLLSDKGNILQSYYFKIIATVKCQLVLIAKCLSQ